MLNDKIMYMLENNKIEEAEIIALKEFDKWNDVTGFVQKHTSNYYEMQAVIKDAVHVGIQMAKLNKIVYCKDGNIINFTWYK